jgi:hypothetical protein
VSGPLTRDTSPEIEQRQVQAWREMSAAHKADLITGLTRTAYEMALAGLRHRYPEASAREHFLRMALLTLGPQLARGAYPDIERLDLVHSPEDVLLHKLRGYRMGEVSDSQWRDVMGIIRTQGDRLDRDYLTANAPILGVERELERALREAGAAS